MRDFILTLIGAQPHQVKGIIAAFKGFAILWLGVLVFLLISAVVMAGLAYLGWIK